MSVHGHHHPKVLSTFLVGLPEPGPTLTEREVEILAI